MPAERNTVYLHLYGRITAIRPNSTVIKYRISDSVNRGSLGWKGESARRTLAASLGEHFAQGGRDGHLKVRHPGDVRTYKKVYAKTKNGKRKTKELKQEHEGVCERTDSMEPLRGEVGKEAAKEETDSYVGWYTSNSRKMRIEKLEEVQEMYRKGRRFTPGFRDEQTSMKQVLEDFADTRHTTQEVMTFSSHHSNNAQAKVSSTPDSEFDNIVLSNHAHSTAVPVCSKPELNINYDNAGNQPSCSEPYPSSAPAPLPQPPTASRSRRPRTPSTVQHPKFSVWPLDRSILHTADQHRQSPALISSAAAQYCSASSRSRSQSAKRDQPHRPANFIEEKEKKSRDTNRKHQHDDNDIVFPPTHPFHGLDAQQRTTYWDTLTLYHSNLPSLAPKDSSLLVKRYCKNQKNLSSFLPVRRGFCASVAHLYGQRAAPDSEYAVADTSSPETRVLAHRMMGRVSEARSRAVRLVRSEGNLSTTVRENVGGEAGARKRGSASRLRDTFACRPGSSTPEVPARTVENEAQPVDVASVPRKYGMAYLARKMRHTPGLCKRSKDEPRRVQEENQDTGEATDQQSALRDVGAGRKSREQVKMPSAEPVKEDFTNGTGQVPTQQAQLLQGTDRTPEITPSASPTTPSSLSIAPISTSTLPRAPSRSPAPIPIIPKTRATAQPSQPQQRRCVSSGSLTLSDRLRTTRLEDIRLRSETAQEIRNLMLDIDRDRRQSLSNTTTTQRSHSLTTAQLPGGFTTTDPNPSDSSFRPPPPSLHDMLDRHFQPRRDLHHTDNDETTDAAATPPHQQCHPDQKPVRLQPSHSTLPRSYKAPDVHE